MYTPRGGFYTLGACAYLDDPDEYPGTAKLQNPVLTKALGPMYGYLAQVLGKHFEKPVVYGPEGLPGFHIFWYSPDREASIHKDTPHLRIKRFQGVDYSQPFSFTAALRLPEEGGGLNMWHNDEEKPVYRAYKLGSLYLHSGQATHQIANTLKPGDLRITLQGHGVHYKDSVQVFF